MDKTFDEAIAGIRKAERGVEVREDIAQGMEYVEQFAEEVTGQQQAALQAAQTATSAASTATEKAAAAAESASTAQTSATSAGQSAQTASTNAEKAEKSAAAAKASADKAAAAAGTDKTLTVDGAPADAKAVGDALEGVIDASTVKALIANALAEDHQKIKFWISEDPTSPAALFGGTWEQIASERVLMGASNTHAAGSIVEAGLPDIQGSAALGYTDWNLVTALKSPSGAFSITKKSGAGSYPSCSVDKNSTAGTNTFSFSASASNAIYGASSTVQPAAYYVYIWHRVA